MKRFPFLQVAVMVALMVVVVGCSMPRSAAGGYYEDSDPANRYGYYDRPYSGNVIVVERDPYTGQYYQVSPYGSYATPYGYYGNGSRYDRRYNNVPRNYDSRRNNGYYRGDNGQKRQAQEQQRRETTRQMDATKESILGKKKN